MEWSRLNQQREVRGQENCWLWMPKTRKSPKQRVAVAESPKFVHESVKDRNMGLLLRTHVGSVTTSEFDFDCKSRLSLQIQRLEGCRVAATLVFC